MLALAYCTPKSATFIQQPAANDHPPTVQFLVSGDYLSNGEQLSLVYYGTGRCKQNSQKHWSAHNPSTNAR